MFKSSIYEVTEGDGSTKPVLILSNPLSTEITIQVTSKAKSATGMYPRCQAEKDKLNFLKSYWLFKYGPFCTT